MSYHINHLSKGMMGHSPTIGHYLMNSSHSTSLRGNLCNAYKSPDGSHYKVPNVHGRKRVTFSTQCSTGHVLEKKHGVQNYENHVISRGHNSWKNTGLFNINEKETMHNLNQRLSKYLEKVSFLEQENAELERKIYEWQENNAPRTLPDCSQYFRTIRELQHQVSAFTLENAQIILHINNAKLAKDDLNNKYEMEHVLRSGAEADVVGLRRALEELNVHRQHLETEVHCLQKEILQFKNEHEEELSDLKSQLGFRVNVTLNAAPSVDLSQALSEIREQYEKLMQRNLREVENIFLNRSKELDSEMSSEAKQTMSFKNEMIDLKHCVKTLEIELQTQLNFKLALEGSLIETESAYGSQLAKIQALINNIEKQLSQIRSDLERQNSNYQELMDQKSLLEMEIAMYKQLLDGHNIKISSPRVSWRNDAFHHDLRC